VYAVYTPETCRAHLCQRWRATVQFRFLCRGAVRVRSVSFRGGNLEPGVAGGQKPFLFNVGAEQASNKKRCPSVHFWQFRRFGRGGVLAEKSKPSGFCFKEVSCCIQVDVRVVFAGVVPHRRGLLVRLPLWLNAALIAVGFSRSVGEKFSPGTAPQKGLPCGLFGPCWIPARSKLPPVTGPGGVVTERHAVSTLRKERLCSG
jgi:hypothetical protein